jgi:hypothetical protein
MYYQWIDMQKIKFNSPVVIQDLVASLLCIFLFVDLSHAYSLTDVAEPPESTVTYVGDVVHNGLPMEILQFSSRYSMTELTAYYKQRWSDVTKRNDSIPSYIEKHVGDWTILSKVEASNNIVVQIRETANGDAEGFISVSDFKQRKESGLWIDDFPRMNGSTLVSNTESDEKGRRAYILIFVNEYSVSENHNFYQSSMNALGWRLSRSGTEDNISMLHLLNKNWYCDIALSEAEDGKSVVLANLVELNER